MCPCKVRIPKQKRSIEIKNKIKKTAQVLFSEKGYYNTSSNEIVKTAGVSIGAFYSYFKDKKALFIEILHDYNQAVVELVPIESIQMSDLKEMIGEYIRAVLSVHNYSPPFHREILAMAYGDNEILEILNHYEATMIDHISKLLIKYHSFTRVNDINNAAYLIYKSVEEVVHGTKVLDYPCDEESLLKELTDMICLYVLK